MSIFLSKIQTCKYNKLFRNKALPSDSFSIRLDASPPFVRRAQQPHDCQPLTYSPCRQRGARTRCKILRASALYIALALRLIATDVAVCYTSGSPVMAAGCSMPMSLRIVGATSASLPFFTSLTSSPAFTTINGTSLRE